MAEDKDREDSTELQQEEYHYSDPDSPPPENYTEEPEKKTTGFMGSGYKIDDRRKRIILVIVILGLIFIVLQFAKAKNKTATEKVSEPAPLSNIEKAAQEQQPIQQEKILPTPLPQPAVVTSTPTPASDTTVTPTPESAPNTTEPVAHATQETTTQNLQTSINNLETHVKNLTESVDLLQTQVQDLLKKRAPVIKSKPIRRKPVYKETGYKIGMHKHNRPSVYYVKAVVPRRAWLEKENGEVLTVQADDRIPGYGRVESIDASEGTVITSSNKVIRFSPN